MKFFAFISLMAALLLGITVETGRHRQTPPARRVPEFLKNYHQNVKASFERPEYANMLFSFVTGNKNGISPYTKRAFKKTNLSFLLSPSGVHLSSLIIFITFLLKRIKIKWLRKVSLLSILSSGLCYSQFYSIKRLIVLRLLIQFKFLTKLNLSIEHLFILTFAFSFLMGDFFSSPLSYIYSFIFLGTFFSLKEYSKFTLIIGLFSTQLILAIFLGEKVSLLAIPVGLLGSFLFSLIFPFLLLFLASFWLLPFNWAEPLLKYFVLFIRLSAKSLNGTFTSSSVFLLAAVWVFLLMSAGKKKLTFFSVLLLLHTNTAMTPVIFSN